MRPQSDRSRQLVDAASELLDEQGPHALSLRRLADAVGTSTQAVYTEFGGKPGLADALFRRGYQRLLDELDGLDPVDDPIERVRVLGHAYRAVARRHPAHYELMTGRPIAEYEAPGESREFAASTMQPLVDAVADAVADGVLVGDAPAIALDLWAAGHGYVSLENAGLIRADDDDFDRYLHSWLRTWAP